MFEYTDSKRRRFDLDRKRNDVRQRSDCVSSEGLCGRPQFSFVAAFVRALSLPTRNSGRRKLAVVFGPKARSSSCRSRMQSKKRGISSCLFSREIGSRAKLEKCALELESCQPKWTCKRTFLPGAPQHTHCPIFCGDFYPSFDCGSRLVVGDEDGNVYVMDVRLQNSRM